MLLTPLIISGATVAALVVLPFVGVRTARRRWRRRKNFAAASDIAVNWESWDDLEVASGRLSLGLNEEAAAALAQLARMHSEDHLTRL